MSPGEAGDIRLEADRLAVRDGATVSTESLLGSGGDIFLVRVRGQCQRTNQGPAGDCLSR